MPNPNAVSICLNCRKNGDDNVNEQLDSRRSTQVVEVEGRELWVGIVAVVTAGIICGRFTRIRGGGLDIVGVFDTGVKTLAYWLTRPHGD